MPCGKSRRRHIWFARHYNKGLRASVSCVLSSSGCRHSRPRRFHRGALIPRRSAQGIQKWAWRARRGSRSPHRHSRESAVWHRQTGSRASHEHFSTAPPRPYRRWRWRKRGCRSAKHFGRRPVFPLMPAWSNNNCFSRPSRCRHASRVLRGRRCGRECRYYRC